MMRSPYTSPATAPPSRYLRRRPPEAVKRHRILWIGGWLLASYLGYFLVAGETGILRIAALKRENEALRERKLSLSVRVNELEQRRREQARDPDLEERVARERFHLMREDEIVYRYAEPEAGPGR